MGFGIAQVVQLRRNWIVAWNALLQHARHTLASSRMSQTVQLTVPMPSRLARLRFPKALDARLQFLLDEQGRRGKLSAEEKKEAEGLVQMAATLSILKLGTQVKMLKP